MIDTNPDRNAMPPYSYVPGGPWPHPISDPDGHSFGHRGGLVPPITGDAWHGSTAYRVGISLFNAGYYWEAHEAWESLWHAHGRQGPIADLLKGLIKLAAAGVKVREDQPHGVTTHASRAASLFEAAQIEVGPTCLGLDLEWLAATACEVASQTPIDTAEAGSAVSIVFGFRLEPR